MKNLVGRTMMKMKDNRKNGRKALKGFTLVEIIVVLVILAILAAAMIPALTGYIDKAKERTLISEARNVLTAAQTLTSEAYGMGKTVQSEDDQTSGTGEDNYTVKYGWSDMLGLADIPTTDGEILSITFSDETKKKVSGLTYGNKKSKKQVVFDGTEFTVSDYTPSNP